jgi:tetratricopeptide (TPR) repeat protein
MSQADSVNHGRTSSARYTLLDKLGAGGQAEIWRARDESSGVEVALKVLTPSVLHNEAAWTALVREHAIASRLDHPLILKVQPPYREGNFAGLPMELAVGGDLRKLRGAGYLEIVPVLIDIAQALEYAHEHGVIHRDLKPGNVLFDAQGRVRIADFGIASAPGVAGGDLSRPGLSPFTASPEQLRGDPPAFSDDIYSLGALAYELLSGYPPYYPRFEVRRVLEEPVPEIKPAQLMPPQLGTLVMRMLSKRPALRPHTMRDVIDELDATLNDTLTFDFESLTESEPGTTPAMKRDASVLAAAEAARSARSRAAPATPAIPAGSPAVSRIDAQAAQSAELAAGMAPRTFRPPVSPSDPAHLPAGHPAAALETTAAFDATHEDSAHTDSIDVIPAEPVRVTNARPVGSPVEAERIAMAAEAVRDVAPELGSVHDEAPRWDELRVEAGRAAHRQRYPEAKRRSSWPIVLLTGLAAAAIAVFVVLPRMGADVPAMLKSLGAPSAVIAAATPSSSTGPATTGEPVATSMTASVAGAPDSLPEAAATTSLPAGDLEKPAAAPAGVRPAPDTAAEAVASTPAPSRAPPVPAPVPAKNLEESFDKNRTAFDERLAALDARGAGVWGGADFAAAKTRAAESVGAREAGSLSLATKRLNEALNLLTDVEARADQNLASQLATGDKALAAGQPEVARYAYESASRIDPKNRRATEGLQRTKSLGGVLPLLADGENAEAAKDYARAIQDYSQALSLDPGNVRAKAGLDRAHASFGQDSYAKAVGTGFAALGAGRLDEARVAFEKARTVRPGGAEAQTGLQRVSMAQSARGYAGTRQKAASLEAEERWTDAFNEYSEALKIDPSLVFAQQGRARAAARADLSNSLQSLIDRPERLAAASVRAEAEMLLRRAAGADPSGPVLRSQIQRLQILLPQFDVPVRLEMVSDNATQVQIQRVGTFGTFSKREIELKPGKYTVVGTRPGFRDVRRDVTIAPGRDVQTISVSCVEPI